MKKDKHGNFIGVGETTAIEILRDIYKDAKIKAQHPFIDLITDNYKDSLAAVSYTHLTLPTNREV